MTKKYRNAAYYIIVMAGFSVLMYWITAKGAQLLSNGPAIKTSGSENHWTQFLNSLKESIEHPLAILLVQIITILFTARVFGWICRKIGQPSVIGEIAAGIVLGPSLIGHYFPGFSEAIFPVSSLPNLQFLSQIGLILFMFVVGMEIDLKVFRNKAQEALIISHASIVLPFAMGMVLAYYIFERYAPSGISFLSFGLFMGIAMSITAFPVLARIVQERGIHTTKLGTMVFTCAAFDDITAWSILAVVIAIVKAGSFISALYTIALSVIYVLLMLKVVRPFLNRVGQLFALRDYNGRPYVAIFFLTLIISAYSTEIIGIHALFGAFLAGAIMPDSLKLRNTITEKIEDVSLVLLLPLFFVYTGLRTEIGLIDSAEQWKVVGLIVLVAVIGKMAGSALSARFVGQSWKESLTIGALMNTRGLMELVVLNIGYDLGVLDPEIFAMMVIMALATTFMTGPALDFINWAFRNQKTGIPDEIRDRSKYKVLFSFDNPESGKNLMALAAGFVNNHEINASLTAMHIAPANDIKHFNADHFEKESFAPVVEASKKSGHKITTLFKFSNDVETDIVDVANRGDYDLLLIGTGHSIFDGSLLGRVLGFTTKIINPETYINRVTGKERLFENTLFDEGTRQVMSGSQVPVGVFVDKSFSKVDSVLLPVLFAEDVELLHYARRLIRNSKVSVTVMDVHGEIKKSSEFRELIRTIEQTVPGHINLFDKTTINSELLQNHNLMLISLNGWKQITDAAKTWLPDIPSTLIISTK